jgi:hypothetical protein
LPVANVRGTSLLVITSPGDDENWVSQIIKATDENGNPLVFNHTFTSVCKYCRKLSPTEMIRCTHKKGAIPMHKERSKTIKYGKLYDLAGLRHKNLQENWGEITRSINCAFPEHLIELAFDVDNKVNVRVDDIGTYIKTIHVCVDPNGGGKNRTAVAIGYLNERTGNVVVSFSFWRRRRRRRKRRKNFYCYCCCCNLCSEFPSLIGSLPSSINNPKFIG